MCFNLFIATKKPWMMNLSMYVSYVQKRACVNSCNVWSMSSQICETGLAVFFWNDLSFLEQIIARPAQDEGALDAFVSVITGPPGPSPIQLLSKISIPVLVLWGDKDPFTPIDGPIGRFFSDLPNTQGNVQLKMLADVGHCPHDDRPELVHNELLPWLATTCNGLT